MTEYPENNLYSPSSKKQSSEPIAIISMACRLPGGINNPDEY